METRHNMTAKDKELIVVTKRNCAPTVQPRIHPQSLWVVIEHGRTPAGTEVLTCAKWNNETEVHRINAKRFSWERLSWEKVCAMETQVRKRIESLSRKKREQKFKEQCKKSYEQLRDSFSDEEHICIAFLPLIIANIAWFYAERARLWCVNRGIQETKQLSRALTKVRDDYDRFILQDLLPSQLKEIGAATTQFLENADVRRNFLQAYYTIDNEFSKKYVGVDDKILLADLRTLAFMAKLMVRAYSRHNEAVNKLFRGRFGFCNSVNNPIVTDKLMACIDAYLGDYSLAADNVNISVIEKVFDISIHKFKFNIQLRK